MILKNILHLAVLLTTVASSNTFIQPFKTTQSKECKRHSVVDLSGWENVTYIPSTDLTISRYSKVKQCVNLPTVLLIPGLEFSGLSLSQYTNQLQNDFEILCVSTSNTAQHHIKDVVNSVETFMLENPKEYFVIGESSGAIMALLLGTRDRISKNVKGICTLNSASAYTNSEMQKMINCGKQSSQVEYLFRMFVFLVKQDIWVDIFNQEKFSLYSLMLLNFIHFPKDVLLKRIDNWIEEGNVLLESEYSKITVPVALVASRKDKMFDSYQEAKRLKSKLMNSRQAKIVHISQGGHLIEEDQFELVKVLNALN
jgi:predicted alpha/beta hydrolase family esterase